MSTIEGIMNTIESIAARFVTPVVYWMALLGLCAAYLQGEYGVKDMFIGVLCRLGGNGMEKVIEIKLNDEERKGLDNSVKAVQELVAALKKIEI